MAGHSSPVPAEKPDCLLSLITPDRIFGNSVIGAPLLAGAGPLRSRMRGMGGPLFVFNIVSPINSFVIFFIVVQGAASQLPHKAAYTGLGLFVPITIYYRFKSGTYTGYI